MGVSRLIWLIDLQGTPDFVAIEVEQACYLFRNSPQEQELPDESETEADLNAFLTGGLGSTSTSGPKMAKPARIWLHNPLHDYESIWWIAVWFLFTSKPKGVDENDMHRAHSAVFGNRLATFLGGKFSSPDALLPKVLHPILLHLESMRKQLVAAYYAFEKSFDGSVIKDIHKNLAPYMLKAALSARKLSITPNVLSRKLEGAEMEFELGTPGEEPSRQILGPEDGGTGHSRRLVMITFLTQHPRATLGWESERGIPAKSMVCRGELELMTSKPRVYSR